MADRWADEMAGAFWHGWIREDIREGAMGDALPAGWRETFDPSYAPPGFWEMTGIEHYHPDFTEMRGREAADIFYDYITGDLPDRNASWWFYSSGGSLSGADIRYALTPLVLDPMGYTIEEGAWGQNWWDEEHMKDVYGEGELYNIFTQTDPIVVGREVHRLEAAGQHWLSSLYTRTYGQAGSGIEGYGTEAIVESAKRVATGQVDVDMDPRMVARMMTRREQQRTQRRYKGGTAITQGLLGTTQEQYRRYLGGS